MSVTDNCNRISVAAHKFIDIQRKRLYTVINN